MFPERIRESIPKGYRGTFAELDKLFSNIRIPKEMRNGMLDKLMCAFALQPVVDMYALDDYLLARYPDTYTEEMSFGDMLEKLDPNNMDLWKFYCLLGKKEEDEV